MKNESDFYGRIGHIIKSKRVEMLLTQDDLAFLLGTSRVAITMIEAGKQKMPLHQFTELSAFFKLDLYWFLGEFDGGIKTMEQLHTHKVEVAKSKLADRFSTHPV